MGSARQTEDGTCKGIAFVNFLAREAAEAAVENLNGTYLPSGKMLKIQQCDPAKGKGGKAAKGAEKGKGGLTRPDPKAKAADKAKANPKAMTSAPTPEAMPIEDDADA